MELSKVSGYERARRPVTPYLTLSVLGTSDLCRCPLRHLSKTTCLLTPHVLQEFCSPDSRRLRLGFAQCARLSPNSPTTVTFALRIWCSAAPESHAPLPRALPCDLQHHDYRPMLLSPWFCFLIFDLTDPSLPLI